MYTITVSFLSFGSQFPMLAGNWCSISCVNACNKCSELSSGLYCRVNRLSTDVSEVRTASIIRDE